jgi:hypothetical protein
MATNKELEAKIAQMESVLEGAGLPLSQPIRKKGPTISRSAAIDIGSFSDWKLSRMWRRQKRIVMSCTPARQAANLIG